MFWDSLLEKPGEGMRKMDENRRVRSLDARPLDKTDTLASMKLPRNIHLVPLDFYECNGVTYSIRPGFYEINGATAIPGGVNFTVHSNGATSISLVLFRSGEDEPYGEIPFPEQYKIGNVYSMIVFQLDIAQFEYAYRVDGPYDPKKGLIFDRSKYLLDPYAKAVTGQREWGEKQPGMQQYKARVVKDDFDWGNFRQPMIPVEDLVIYELHVRGFTMDSSSGVKHPGTFEGLREKIPYLKALGVNAVELMPIFEFDEMQDYREHEGKKLYNYWGYSTVSFFAPNTSYSASTEHNREGNELKKLIRELNENGIEVYLDVVFNHTAEGNEQGPFFSFKGFDNNIYYLLTPDGYYYNFSGCGNTLNCNHPIVHQMILDCLRYWVTTYRVDGFRFDLASILGRNEDGSSPRPGTRAGSTRWAASPAGTAGQSGTGSIGTTCAVILRETRAQPTQLPSVSRAPGTSMMLMAARTPRSTSSPVTMGLPCTICLPIMTSTMSKTPGTIPTAAGTTTAGTAAAKARPLTQR